MKKQYFKRSFGYLFRLFIYDEHPTVIIVVFWLLFSVLTCYLMAHHYWERATDSLLVANLSGYLGYLYALKEEKRKRLWDPKAYPKRILFYTSHDGTPMRLMDKYYYLHIVGGAIKIAECVVFSPHDVNRGFAQFLTLPEAYDYLDKLTIDKSLPNAAA